jgi:iron(III) transport system permease protein
VIETFEVPGTIGLAGHVTVFSSAIYDATHPGTGLPDYGSASTLALLVIAIAAILIWVHGRLTRQASRFVTVTGKGYTARTIEIGRWRWVALAGIALYALIAIGLPLFIVGWASLHKYYQPPSRETWKTSNLDAYRTVFGNPDFRDAALNTLEVALLAATLTMALVSVIAWVVVRSQIPGRKLLDLFSFLPHAIPGIVVGLAILMFYLTFPIGLYGTLFIIVVALVTKYVAFGTRTMNSGMIQISNELEDASRVAGAGWGRTFLMIMVPLLAPVLMNGWIWVAIHASRELSAPLMLSTPGNTVLSTLLWSRYTNGELPLACVVGVVLIAVAVVFGVVGRTLTRHFSLR